MYNYLTITVLSFSKCQCSMSDIIERCIDGDDVAIINSILNQPRQDCQPNNWDWNTLLQAACIGGNVDVVQLMISKGANDWPSGFQAACKNNHVPIAELMNSKISKDGGTCDWRNGFDLGCLYGNLDIVLLAISKLRELQEFSEFSDLHQESYGWNRPYYWDRGLYCANYKSNFAISTTESLKVQRLMILNGATNINSIYGYSKNFNKIIGLLYLEVPIETFSGIEGYENILARINNVKQSILNVDVMLVDLLSIVSRCIIV